MTKSNRGVLFYFNRWIARIITSRHTFVPQAERPVPAVYLVHHQNTKGPLVTMAWLPFPLRPWVLGVFCSHRNCFRQYYDYTFTKRFGMSKVRAAILAFPLSYYIAALMHSMRAIPVFRESKSIVITFRSSIEALVKGESILISPDIEYDSTNPMIGEMYQGFFDLEKYYFKQTGQHLAFIPLHINAQEKCIYAGQAVYFQSDNHFKQEKSEAYQRLKDEFLRLANVDGTLDTVQVQSSVTQ
jgi:hypothetical protein